GCRRATRPDAEGRDPRQPVVGARSLHHGPRPGAVGDRHSQAQRSDAAGHGDLGIERGVCYPGAWLSCGVERRKILPRNSWPRRRRGRDRPDKTQCRWRRDQPRPSRWHLGQPNRAASRQCDEAAGYAARRCHRMHRRRAGRRHADRDGVIMESRIIDVLGDRVLALGPKPDATSPYRHFKLTRHAAAIAWLLFDREGSSANTLSADVMEEFDQVLAALESRRPAGLVIRSAKKSGFIAGADVNEFRGASDPSVVETAISRAHAVIDRLEALRVP